MNEYGRFITWLVNTVADMYGWDKANEVATSLANSGLNETNYTSSPYYRKWVAEGQPEYTPSETSSASGEITYDDLVKWILDTYGWFSKEYNDFTIHYGHKRTDWKNSKYYAEMKAKTNGGSSGWDEGQLTDEQRLSQAYDMPATNANEVINKYIEISQFGQDAIDVWLRNAPNEAALLFTSTSFPQTQDGYYIVGDSYYQFDNYGIPHQVIVSNETQVTPTRTILDNNGKVIAYEMSDGTYILPDGSPVTLEQVNSLVQTSNQNIATGDANNPQLVPSVQNTPGYEWSWDGNQWVETPIAEEDPSIPEGYTYDPNSGLFTDGSGQFFVWQNGQMIPSAAPTDPNALTEQQRQQLEIQREQMALQAQELKMYADQMAKENQLKEAQMAMEYAQYLADLASNPGAFLTYAVATGQPGVVQNFMPELLYGQNANLQAGDVLPGWEGPNYQPSQQTSQGYSEWGTSGQGGSHGGGWTPSPTAGQTTPGPQINWANQVGSGPSTSQSLSQATQNVVGGSANMGGVTEPFTYTPEYGYPGKSFNITPESYSSTGGNFPVNWASGTLQYDAYVAMARAAQEGLLANESEWEKAARSVYKYGPDAKHWLAQAFLQYSPRTYTPTETWIDQSGQQQNYVDPWA